MIRAIAPSPPERQRPTQRSRRRAAFVKTDLTRAYDAAQKVGFQVRSIEISKDGHIRLYADDGAGAARSPFDEWDGRL